MEHSFLASHKLETLSDKPVPSSSETPGLEDVKAMARRLSRSPDMIKTQKRWRKVTGFIITLGVITAVFFGWRAYQPQSVEVTIVSYQRAGAASQPVLRQSGYVGYPHSITVGSNSSAVMAQIYFKEGDVVKQGELLARFETRTLEAQKNIKEAAVLNARQTLARTQNLYTAGAVSSVELQQAEINLQTAGAEVELINAQIADAYVRAPFDGRILEQLAEVGERVGAGICILADDSVTLIEFEINQEDLSLLKAEQPALVVLDAYPEKEYAGRLFRLSVMANRTTNTIQAEVALLDPDAQIFPNMSARVYLVNEAQTKNKQVLSVLAVDKSAIFEEQSIPHAWIVEGGRVYVRQVKTGASLGDDKIEILEGLIADDAVVNQPANYRFEGGERVVMGN